MTKVPVAFHASFKHGPEPKALARALARMRENCNLIYAARSHEALCAGAKPGLSTLICPALSQRYDELRSHVWGTVTTSNKEARELIKAKHPAFLLRDEKAEGFEKWVRTLRRPLKERSRKKGAKLEFCSVIDRNYFPHWYGLVENLRQVSEGPLKAHLLALDAESARLAKKHLHSSEIRVYELEEVFTQSELRKVVTRSTPLQAFSSKPAILAHALKRAEGPVFLLDADLYFFESPQMLLEELKEKSLLLFPQWNDDIQYARLHGLFNTGMVLAREDSLPFVSWWRELCLWECREDTSRGFFIDQGYMDLAPLYFDDVAIYRRGDHNSGKWNLSSLGIQFKAGRPALSDGTSLKSYHAALVDDLGLYDYKATWDQLQALELDLATPSLVRQTLQQQARVWPALKLLQDAQSTLKNRLHLPIGAPSERMAKVWTDARFEAPRNWITSGYRKARELKRLLVPTEKDT